MTSTNKRRKIMSTAAHAASTMAIRLAVLLTILTGNPVPAYAQSVASAAIQGQVTDESAGALPGVTVTVTSPALQVPQVVVTTEADGTYRVPDLPSGVYQIEYELSGFQKFVRSGVQLAVGFVAKIDVPLKIGGMQETVQVSGASPVVDVATTATSTNFNNEVLQSVPRGRAIWDVLAMAPGVTVAAAPDVGDSNMSHRSNITNYGGSGQPKLAIEGVNVQTLNDRSGAYYMDYANFDEVQVKAAGNDAEMSTGGLNFLAVIKSGGNQFHGTYHGAYQSQSMQANNIDAGLTAQGVQNSAPLRHYYDASGDLGGRLIRDRLWFYGAAVRQELVTQLLGFERGPGPDGTYLTSDDEAADTLTRLDNETLKVSLQLAPKYKLLGVYQRGVKFLPDGAQDGSRFRPFEATTNYHFRSLVSKAELQGTPTDRLLFNVVGGYFGYVANYTAQSDDRGNPSRQELETTLFTGPTNSASRRPVWRYQSEGSVTYFGKRNRTGKHDLKAGYSAYFEGTGTSYLNKNSGNYLLTFDHGAASQITTYNYPVDPVSKMRTVGVYVKDAWTVGPRLTANIGVRWDRYHSLVPEQTKVQGVFGTAGAFPRVDVLTWNRAVPRVGLAWDVAGNGRTVVKGTYGLFNYSMGAGFASAYNQNALTSTTYRWRDVNGNRDYDTGEVNLDTNSTDFISVSGASNNLLNPDLRQPLTTEATASIERELLPNVAVRGTYVYKKEDNLYRQINVLRPLEAYNIPVQRTDPGPDGALGTGDDGGAVTLYDYDAAYRGSKFVGNQYQNSPNDDTYNSLEASVTRRTTKRWGLIASFGATRNHRWLTSPASTPADLAQPVDNTWTQFGRISGSYQLPYDVQVGLLLQSQSGTPGQRTFVFRQRDNSGPALVQLTTLTMRLDPFGEEKGPATNTMNLRLTKAFRVTATSRMGIELNLYNVLNSNAATATTYVSGPTYGYVTEILPPRIVRVGLTFDF
jgi:hypothetical protein